MCVFQRWRQRSGLFRHEVEECKVLGVWICLVASRKVQGVDEANIKTLSSVCVSEQPI